jgi:hypothetical protein
VLIFDVFGRLASVSLGFFEAEGNFGIFVLAVFFLSEKAGDAVVAQIKLDSQGIGLLLWLGVLLAVAFAFGLALALRFHQTYMFKCY